VFEIGFSELVLIALLALIVLGPQRLPEAARAAGRWMARLRRFVAEVKRDFDRELASEELAELRRLKAELDETRRVIGESSEEILRGLNTSLAAPAEKTEHAVTAPAAASGATTQLTVETPLPGPEAPPPRAEPPVSTRRRAKSAATRNSQRQSSHGRPSRPRRKDRGR
jgi:sec-independent protein translocase protein TatB